jgi:hypothetical protein
MARSAQAVSNRFAIGVRRRAAKMLEAKTRHKARTKEFHHQGLVNKC